MHVKQITMQSEKPHKVFKLKLKVLKIFYPKCKNLEGLQKTKWTHIFTSGTVRYNPEYCECCECSQGHVINA
jgi:hypothetical protein